MLSEKADFPFAVAHKEGLRLNLHVQPGAAKSEFAGTHGDELKIRIKARPVEGEANKAVCAFLAEVFALSKTSVSIVKGETSRSKAVLLMGDTASLIEKLRTLDLNKR